MRAQPRPPQAVPDMPVLSSVQWYQVATGIALFSPGLGHDLTPEEVQALRRQHPALVRGVRQALRKRDGLAGLRAWAAEQGITLKS